MIKKKFWSYWACIYLLILDKTKIVKKERKKERKDNTEKQENVNEELCNFEGKESENNNVLKAQKN